MNAVSTPLCLSLSLSKLPPHGYIMYVGITGNDSGGTLYKRYQRYWYEFKTKGGRPAVFYMMDNWRDDLFFHFVPLPNTFIDLSKIEKSFINAVLPPVNKADIVAEPQQSEGGDFLMKIQPITLPALRGTFGDWIYYICLIPLEELGRRAMYAHEIHPNKALSEPHTTKPGGASRRTYCYLS